MIIIKEKDNITDDNVFEFNNITVKIEIEVNGNVILTEYKCCSLGERQFFKTYVDDRLKEDFEILSFANVNGEKCLILKKDNVVLRCRY